MSINSDHTQPQINITEYIPDVYNSDVNRSMIDMAFNRHLTKDDTQRVAGLVGQFNPNALVNRQITESTPHRQAYQLAPTMYTRVGTIQTAFSFKAFQQQLKLVGVDIDRYPQWGNTLQFNWVPPVNLDMLVNYQDYFWQPPNLIEPAQYLTIEDRCKKVKSKVISYQNMLQQRGSEFSVVRIDYASNAFILDSKLDDLFIDGFVFFTKNSTNVNLQNKYWTTVLSTYDVITNQTTIVVNEPISIQSATPPVATYVGQWWYDTSTNILNVWTGAVWQPTSPLQVVTISLTELLSVFQTESNCFCNQDYGWDVGLWDDNQIGVVVWNTALLSCISHSTYSAWFTANNITLCHPLPAPQVLDLWYDTTLDELNQYDGSSWISVVGNFSAILVKTTGMSRWDLTTDPVCSPQISNQWVTQNHWIHKSEVQSFVRVKRAQLPILEYNSNVELNEWARDVYGWKYRKDTNISFASTTVLPTRFELEPVKGYEAVNILGIWYLFLFDKTQTVNRDIDYTDTFVPGYKFKITDDVVLSDVYTVALSEYRETKVTDPLSVQPSYFVTVVQLVEPVFVTPSTTTANTTHIRIEPLQTSQGDTWRGYHAHWMMDTTNLSTTASPPQSWDVYRRRSLESSPTLISVPDGILSVGAAHQELTVNVINVTTILLDSTLTYDPLVSTTYVTPGSNDLRVYINDIRQYGNYIELTSVGVPNFTTIGFSTYTTMQIPYVTGIQFDSPLNIFDIVRIEVGPAAFGDMGMISVPVRTIEDEVVFSAAISAGTQPIYTSLTQHKQVEQAKNRVNQYPLFNVYNVVTGDIVEANPIFSFSEDPSYPINTFLQRRIVSSTDGKEYQFTQHLLDRDDHLLYGYRNISKITPDVSSTPQYWWYSSITNMLKGWDGKAWTNNIVLYATGGTIVIRQPIISSTEPTSLANIEQALWYNHVTNVLYVRNILAATWDVLNAILHVGADPTLQTIWKHGTNNEQFIPQYVDSSRTPITVGSPQGDWQLPDQWMFNPEHKNKGNILLSELVTHADTILSSQPKIPGLMSGGLFTLTHDQFNYGLGGTIKEHNDGFDTLISAFNVTNTTPVGVIEFAQDEYASNLLVVRELFTKSILTLFTQYSINTIVDFSSFISNGVILSYEQNEFFTQVYGDTSAFNNTTKQGIEHWISTVPMFGLGSKHVPHLNIGNNFIEVFHHDGHRSQITMTRAETDRFARVLTEYPDARSGIGKLGIVSALPPPSSDAAFVSAFGTGNPHTGLLPGVYWYHIGISNPTLYRFEVYAVAYNPPPFYLNGNELPDGTQYYSTADDLVYEKSGLVWVQVSITPDDISSLWKIVDFSQLLAELYLEVETRLYEVTPNYTSMVFDYNTLVPLTPPSLTLSEQATYDRYYFDRFSAFVVDRNIKAPLINTGYNQTDPFTWNYIVSIITTPPRNDITPSPAASWQEIYTRWYGTPYPHLEPWALQGFTDKPSWWDAEYRDTTNTRVWLSIMWTNVLSGVVPPGRLLQDGVTVGTGILGQVTTFAYVSVNINSVSTVDGYGPDQLFPPFYALGAGNISSLYTIYATEIVSPAADYSFGDVGPVEWTWTTSIQYVYDKLVVAFLMQPVHFLHYTFGPQFIDVDSLQVESTFEKVYAHTDALFHGDLYDINSTYDVRGLNQWYVNFNRFSGFDTNAHFRQQWAGWVPELTYQFGGIADADTFSISNNSFDINDQDYNIILVNNGVIKDMWVDAFEVSILSMPPSLIQYNNQGAWKLEINTLASIARSLSYYGVKSYSCTADRVTDEIRVLRYRITSATALTQQFTVGGDQTNRFLQGSNFTVSSSITNDGIYTVQSATYQPVTGDTRIVVVESVVDSGSGGVIDLNSALITWDTGDRVVVSSTKLLPAPLLTNTAYYLIKISTNVYKLAETQFDAFANIPIDITTNIDGLLTIAEISSSFTVFGGADSSKETWYHFALDTNEVRTITPPYSFMGIQSLIDIIDGYSEYQKMQGILYGVGEGVEFDPVTGRLVDWQLEVERCIDWAYGLRKTRVTISDRYGFSVGPASNELSFADSVPQWASGTQVVVSTSGILPVPLLANTSYYYQQTTTPGVFQLSITSVVFDISSTITFTTNGSGSLYISRYDNQNAFPTFEINPSRNNIWLDTPQGVLSNIIEGPYSDIRVQQTIFDQYSRPLKSDKLTVYREDKRSHISIRPEVANDVDLGSQNDPYNYIHFGGGHFFIEDFEHFLLFNDRTVGGGLIYSPFLGLVASRFNVDYYEKEDYSLRPTLGGFYLHNGQFKRNIEGVVSDMQNFYDTLSISETSNVAQHARALVGYTGRSTFMDMININLKSQFIFYKGMIQAKGSVNSMLAYTNSRRFVDAQVDEFWAWKIAEFGDIRPRKYPEIKLFSTDGLADDIRLEFLANSELDTDPDVVDAVATGFNLVSFRDETRWNIFPEQKSEILSPLFLDAEITSITVIFSGVSTPSLQQVADGKLQYWFDGNVLSAWDSNTNSWILYSGKVKTVGTQVYIKHDTICDGVRMYRRELKGTGADFNNYTTVPFTEGIGPDQFTRNNAELLKVGVSSFTDILVIFTVNPSQKKISPAKLIDIQSNVVIQDIPLWHPALGYQYHLAEHNIDLQTENDPARYQFTLNPTDVSQQAWNQSEVGIVWLDTSTLGYMPYYDDKVYPNINDRLYNWGYLAPWASIKTCVWVRSTIPPSSWDAEVIAEANSTTITQNDKVTGTPRQALFKRTRTPVPTIGISFSPGTGGPATIEIANDLVFNDDEVLFITTGILPAGMLPGVKYTVVNKTVTFPTWTFQIQDPDTLQIVDITDTGTVDLTVVPVFKSTDWNKQQLLREKLYGAFDVGLLPAIEPSLTVQNVLWSDGDVAEVYKNGVLVAPNVVVTGGSVLTSGTGLVVTDMDIIDVIRPLHTPTDTETAFDPDTEDDGTINEQWKQDYEYTVNTTTTGGINTGITSTTYYYFWVEKSTTRNLQDLASLSVFEISQQLENIPTPHFVVQKPKDDPILVERFGYGLTQYGSNFNEGSLPEQFFVVPVLYRQAILRQAASYITDDNRYMVRFVRDLTLRDNIFANNKNMNLKDKHEEWVLFREKQPDTVSLTLWNRLMEAMMGYTLTNSAIRVPSLERELYDITYGTDTRFGLGVDQAFVDKTLAIASVLSYLQDPANDFYPADIDNFFNYNNFDTPEAVRSSMTEIYNTFPVSHVNAIWFSTLQDALTTRAKYKELMKTSWVALHGVRVLEVGNLFDN